MKIESIIQKAEENGIKVVGFDIFDTLIFRTVKQPSDVFIRMYEDNLHLFPEYTNEEDFVSARIYAEKCARKEMQIKRGTTEVSLKDIYTYLPTVYTNKCQLMEIELETECRCAVKNVDIEDTVLALKDKNMDVVLISDMYLTQKQIKRILRAAGVDLEVKIYVSVEYGISKSSGKLYEKVIRDLGISNREFMHVGDNFYGDIGATNRKGILNYHYDAISNGKYFFPFLEVEEQVYRLHSGASIHAFRLLSAANTNYDENQFWFQLGAAVVGPFLTYAAEWVLDVAEKEKRFMIRPLMREGKFICELLSRSAEYRDVDFDIEPIYISRFSVFSSVFDEITPQIIENITSTCNMYTKDVFDILKIPDLIGKYEQYANKYINELSMIVDKTGG